jgi:hypothetical protein
VGGEAARVQWRLFGPTPAELSEFRVAIDDGDQCWRSTKVAFCDQRDSRWRVGVRPVVVTLAAASLGGVGGCGGEGLVFA